MMYEFGVWDYIASIERHWNMLAVDRDLIDDGGRRFWAVKFERMTMGENSRFQLEGRFFWLRHRDGSPLEEIDPTLDGHQFLEELAGLHDTPGRGSHPLVSGRAFEVRLETQRDAERMRSTMEFQWACAVIAAMAGAEQPENMDLDVHKARCSENRVIAWLQAVKAAGPEPPLEDRVIEG